MISPIVFGNTVHPDSGVWATLVAGGVLMTFGMIRLLSPGELPVLSWINLALGACILLSPWLLRFASNEARMWAVVAVGGLIMLLAALSVKITLLMRQRVSRA